jgi:hypothetical protein
VIDSCGTCDAAAGQFCGGGGPSKCGTGTGGGDGGAGDGGTGICVPLTCTDVGANCGKQSDGCGGLIDCGTCTTAGETCGGAGVPSRCGKSCSPITTCPAGQNCGVVADGCGGVVSCGGACATGTCGGGGTPNVCGSAGGGCTTGLCTQQTTCPTGGTTSISGTVTAPNGSLPIYGALVFVPTAPIQPFTPNVSCDQCGASVGPVLISTTTGPDGKFLLPNMPVSSATGVQNIPVVIQLGRWRKQLTVVTTACKNTVVPTVSAAAPTTLLGGGARPSPDHTTAAFPRNQGEGDIPLTAISTGNVDGLECVFRKIGVADSEFTDPSGTGRIQFYQDNGAVITKSAGKCSVSGATCTNFGSNCGNRCSVSGQNCNTAGTNCLSCSVNNNTCNTVGAACDGPRCSSNSNSCTTLGSSCDSGRGTCTATLRCTSGGSRCNANAAVGSACDNNQGTCVANTCTAGGTCTSAGTCNQSGGTPAANTLYNDPLALEKYDMTIFECVGSPVDKTATQQANVRDYANKGGRVYATHYSYVWLYNTGAAPWNKTASWVPDTAQWTSAIATLDTTFPKGVAFAQWLNVVNGLNAALPSVNPPWNPPPKITINEARHDVNDPVVAPAQRWLYTTTADTPKVASVQHYTFNTDWNKPAAEQCGRVLYSDFHVTTNSTTDNVVFPNECDNNALTQQEKVLAFMLFDLASCVSTGTTPTNGCNPLTCAAQGVECGQAGDGCGNVITCPNCPAGQTCGGGGVPNKCGASSCTPKACPAGTCGTVADGCGGTSPCVPCAGGQTCGGGGTPGVCGSGGPGCTKAACPAQAAGSACGPVADGCGGLLSCSCPSGMSCINGKCATSSCTPRTCSAAGANCGQVADGCGGLLDCGPCLAPLECGGGGIANVCGGAGGPK